MLATYLNLRPRHSTTARSVRRAVAVAATAAVLAGLQSSAATAYVQQPSGANPGHVVAYQLQGSHFDTCPTVAYSCWNAQIYSQGPTVYRSRATAGTQQIAAAYMLQIWTGTTWVNLAQRTYVRYLVGGYPRLTMPNVEFLPNRAGTFRVAIAIAWRTHDGSQLLGGRAIGFVNAGDYRCDTSYPCRTGTGWVWLRSPHV